MSQELGGEKTRGARIVPAEAGLEEAVARLRAGQLVAFPTETVYGLGANALDGEAVASIFAAKGRPASNPVIVHVADPEAAAPLVRDWSATAQRLAERFWPGPLTLVVPRSAAVPDIVTAGGDTVGIRIPAHPVARELLRHVGIPIAAPSANRSEEVSPTTAQHVADSLGPWVRDLLILDGGPCEVGLESTVVDITLDPPHILRPGILTEEQVREITGGAISGAAPRGGVARSPGQMTRHYAPGIPVLVLPTQAIREALEPDDALLFISVQLGAPYRGALPFERGVVMSSHADRYGRRLYSALRQMESLGARRILIEEPPHGPEWAAIHDRLRRAAAPKTSYE